MSVNESLEYFPLFDPDTSSEAPAVSVAVGDGIAALGTPDALGGAGAVVLYMYSAAENGWGYVGVLTGSSIDGSQQVRGLGSSCAVIGNKVLVGAHGDATTPGRVYVLSPPYGSWSYTVVPVVSELARPEPTKGDRFGASIDCCTDGTHEYVVVGAPEAAAPTGTTGNGLVFVFRGLESKDPWITKPLANPNAEGTATDRFGASIAVDISKGGLAESAASLTVAAGAPGAFEGQGAVFVGRTALDDPDGSKFEFDSPLVPSFPDASDEFRTTDFGSSVAIDRDVLAVGSPGDPNFALQVEGTGAVWIYKHAGGAFVTGGGAALEGATADGKFGASLRFARSEDADTAARHLVVGAPGARRSFTFTGEGDDPTFSQAAELETIGGKDGDRFGAAVSGFVSAAGASFLCAAAGNPKAQIDGGGFLFSTAESAPTWMRPPRLFGDSPLRWAGLPLDWWKKWTPQIGKYIG